MNTKTLITKDQVVAGAKIKCIIDGIQIDDARIQIQDNRVYICQNRKDGERCGNKLGYHYSWCIGPLKTLKRDTVISFFRRTHVHDVCLNEPKEWDDESN